MPGLPIPLGVAAGPPTFIVSKTGGGSASASAGGTKSVSAVVNPSFVKFIASVANKTAGTSFTVPIFQYLPVVGNRLILAVYSGATASMTPTITDPRGNVWVTDATNGSAASGTPHGHVFSTQVATAYQAGDNLTINYSASDYCMATLNEFANVADGAAFVADVATGSSTAPSSAAVTSGATDLVFGSVGVNGPTGDVFTQDTSIAWNGLTRVGTTGQGATSNGTLNTAYIVPTGPLTDSYAPTLGTSRAWVATTVAYHAPMLPGVVDKTGGGAAQGSAGGAKAVGTAASKTGGGAAVMSVGGTGVADTQHLVSAKTGGASAVAASGGLKKAERTQTGGGFATAKTGGVKFSAVVKSGGGFEGASSGGVKTVVSTETGGAATRGIAGGAKVALDSKAGGGAAVGLAGGPKFEDAVKVGGATAVVSSAGFDVLGLVQTKTGGGRIGYELDFIIGVSLIGIDPMSPTVGGAVGGGTVVADLHATTYADKAGGGAAVAWAGGAKITVRVATGGGVAAGMAGGSKVEAAVKAGGGFETARAGGPKVMYASKPGGAFAVLSAGGPKIAGQIRLKTGGSSATVSAAGGTTGQTLVARYTPLRPTSDISLGWIVVDGTQAWEVLDDPVLVP